MKIYQLDFEKSLDMTTVDCIWIATDGSISIPEGSDLVDIKEIEIPSKYQGIDVVVKTKKVMF